MLVVLHCLICLREHEKSKIYNTHFYIVFVDKSMISISATAIGVIRILPIPIIKSILSRMVHSDKQGKHFSKYFNEAYIQLKHFFVKCLCQVRNMAVFFSSFR